MYWKILVPLGGSPNAEKVLPLVEQIVVPGGEVILLRVLPIIETVMMGWPVEPVSERERVQREEAMAYLESVAKRFGGPALHKRCEVISAKSVADGIADFAAREGVDLIAVYSRDRTGLSALISRSVAQQVKRKTPIEVRIFGPQEISAPAPAEMQADAAMELKKCMLAKSDLFKGLSDTQIGKLAALASVLKVPAGTRLGEAGKQGDTLYVLVQGDAQLSTASPMGEITVRIAGDGESFPLAALLGDGTLLTSGKTLTEVELISIPRSALVDLLTREPDIGMRVYANIGHVFLNRYGKTLEHLMAAGQRQMEDAEFLANV